MKKIGALKWLLKLKNVDSKSRNALSNFDNPLLQKWQVFFSELPKPYAPLEIGSYKVYWNSLLRSRAGLCKPHLNLIELNPHILKTAEEIEKTLVHELCHLSVSRRFWQAEAHGLHWKKLMIHCGFEPRRCHNLENARVFKQKRHPLHCECQVHMVSTRLFNRIQKGGRYKCLNCKSILKKSQAEAWPLHSS